MGQCMKVGCAFEATHGVKIIVPDEDERREPCEGVIPQIQLCKVHAETFPARDLMNINPEIASLITNAAAPGAALDFDAAFAEAISLGSAEYLAFAGVLQKVN